MRQSLTGGAYQSHSVIASAQRSVNLFSEPLPTNLEEPAKAADYPTPGLRLLSTIGTGPIRGIRQATNGNCYVVSGNEVYSVNTTSWIGTSLGSITAGLTTPVSMADNTLDLVIVDGSANGWTVNLAGNTFAPIVDPTGMFTGADRVDYVDTFLVFNKPNTPQFYISGSLAITFDPLDFANKSSYSDLLSTLIVAKREVWLLGERTTEVWYDAGATDIGAGSFPFAEVQSVFVDHGIVAKYSVANYDNGIFWLTRDRQGQGFVVMGAGYQTKRISTYAIEAEIAGYARIDDAIGFCYQLAGHTFYVLTFPHADHTWVHDITTGVWHEWVWIDSNGEEHRHRANCFAPVDATLVVGDWQSGNIYALDQNVFTDNGQPIKRLRSFPHVLNEGKRVFYRQFLADMETGTSQAVAPGEVTRLSASFTAADGTALEAYTSEIGGGWAAVASEATGQIQDNRLIGTGGDAMYQSAAFIVTPDYSVRFNVKPESYSTVVADTSLWAIGRASGTGSGYRAKVSADGTQYTLSLAVAGGALSASVAMGTLTSGIYTVWLRMLGSTIIAQVQRSQDGRLLRTDGTWQTSIGTIAAQFTDTTYTAPGAIMVGGTWPVPVPVTPAGVTATHETPLGSDPNFPGGYNNQVFKQAFDFTRNWFYQPILGIGISSGVGGIAVTDLSTMTVIKTATLAQMYAGTSYGHPAGSPPSQVIYDVAAGNDTDLYLKMDNGIGGVAGEFGRFTRVDPVTMKVTGEFYTSNSFPPPLTCVMGIWGVVNTTATHTIVAYSSRISSYEPQIFDGTGMAPIGLGPTPTLAGGDYNAVQTIAGQKYGDGSCDLLMLNSDANGPTGTIDIWRIHITDGLAMTSIKTGTVNVLPIFDATAHLYIAQMDYDTTHDTIILQVTNSSDPAGPPVWVMSVNFDGTINWVQSFPSDIGVIYSKGQSLLTGTTVMTGSGIDLKLLDTATGDITFTGTVFDVSGSYYRVYDGSRDSYWTYALGVFGFTRIDFHAAVIPPTLGMDDVVATTEAALSSNLISLSYSDDRGHSYGNPISQSIGEVGEYRTSLQWQRLGMARDRTFKLEWSVPCRTALQGCWVDVTPAQS